VARQIVSKNTFSNGSVAETALGRLDVAEYDGAVRVATNVTVLSQGPIRKRNGYQFITESQLSSDQSRLVKFQLNRDSAFCLEFAADKVRIIEDGAVVLDTVDLTNGTFDTDILGWTDASETNGSIAFNTASMDIIGASGDEGIAEQGIHLGENTYTLTFTVDATITYTVYSFELNANVVSAAVASGTHNISVPITASGAHKVIFARTSNGTTNLDTVSFTSPTYFFSHPYTVAQLQDIQYQQVGKAMYFTHSDVAPWRVLFSSSSKWENKTITFEPPPTFENGDETLDGPWSIGLTTINLDGTGSFDFQEADVGRHIINTTGLGDVVITAYTNAHSVSVSIVEAFSAGTIILDGSQLKMTGSPVAALEFDGTSAGAVITVKSEYQSDALGEVLAVTGVSKANPGILSTASTTGFVDGDKIQIQHIVGMTQINDRVFTVDVSGAGSLILVGENTSGYLTYSSGGIFQKQLQNNPLGAFRSTDIGKYIIANGGVLQILTVPSAGSITCQVLKSLNSSDDTNIWTLEEDDWSATRGYPRAIGVHNQRLIYAGTDSEPVKIWMSETGIFEGFGLGPDAEDSVQFGLAGTEVNQINWIMSSRDLVVGTSGAEITLENNSTSGITPTDLPIQKVRQQHGSDTQQPIFVNDEILFIQGRTLRAFRYDFNIDAYRADDLFDIATHLVPSTISRVAYAREPETIIYAITAEGNILAGTYDRSKKVIGWTEFTTNGTFLDIIVLNNSTNDEVYALIERVINGSTDRNIERLQIGDGTDDLHAFMDSYLTLSTPLTITGITAANPAVVTSASHGLSDDDIIIIKDITDPFETTLDSDQTNMSDLNQCTFTVANKTANTFELSGKDTSAFNAYGSGGEAFLKVTTVSGLTHLEGETVQILIDGATHADKTVSSGAITLDSSAGEVLVGLKYKMTIQTLPLEYEARIGSMEAQRVSFSKIYIQLYNSTVPTVNDYEIPSRSVDDRMNKKVPLKKGYSQYSIPGWSDSASFTITDSQPLPIYITNITAVIDSGVK
jgi:hypothetical protein